MATLRTILELALRGGTETQRQLEQVGKVGAEAFKKIDEGAKKVPASLRAVDAAASTVKGSLDGVAASAGPLGSALQAIGGPIAALSIGALGAGAAFAGLTKKAFDAAGALVDAADATGLTVEELQKYHLAAATASVSSGEFDAAVQTLNRNVGQAQLGTGRLAKLLGTLDQRLLNSLTSATTSGERFELLAQKLATTESASQRTAIAIAAGGESMVKLLPLLKDGENGFTAIGVAAQQAGAIMSDEAARAADDAADKFTVLAGILEGQVNAAFVQTAPLIENIATAALAAIPSVVAFVNSFLPAATNNEALRRVEESLTRKRNELENIQAQGFDSAALKSEIANLEKDQARLRDLLSEAAAAAKARREAVRDAAKKEADAARVAAQAAADRKVAEREAEAAAKRAVTAHEQGIKKLQELRDKDTVSALDAISKIEAERDIAYREWAEQAAAANLTQEQLAEGYFLIWSDADKRITEARAEEERKRAEEADKQRREALRAVRDAEREALELGRLFVRESAGLGQAGAFFGLDRETMAKLFKGGKADAEEFAENLEGIMDNVWGSIGNLGRDALRDLFHDSELDAEAFADALKDIILQALLDIAGQQIILPIVAQVVGATGFGGQAGAGSGDGLGGLLNTGQQLLSFGNTLKSGFNLLSGALGGATEATGLLASDIAALGSQGITLVGSGAPLTAGETALLFPNAGTTGTGAFTAGSSSGALAGAATSGAILFAVVAALESLQAGLGAIKQRDSIFNYAQMTKAVGDGFSPWVKTLGNIVAYVGTGHSGADLQKSTLDVLGGQGSGHDYVKTIMYAILNPMLFNLSFWMKDLSTGGTALRKQFEEFIENDEIGSGFFGRDSGTFKRGVGQTGLSANDVHGSNILEKFRLSIGQGARGIADAKGIDFVEAQKEFIQLQKESIGLTDDQLKQVTGLSAAFRAFVGGQAGEEETRTFGVIADFLGSIAVEGASAAEAMDIVANAVAQLGRPDLVFQKLNEFFVSGDNDIQVDTYREAIQGLASALFRDLPAGVDAAAIALRELQKAGDGKVTLEAIEKQVAAAVAEAQAIGPALQGAFEAGLNDAELDLSEFGTAVFDAAEDALKNAAAQLSFETFIADAFKGDVFAPLLEQFAAVKTGLGNKTLTDAEANEILAQAATDARANLETLRPLIEAAVQAGRDLAAVFDDAAAAADEAADAIAKAQAADVFKGDINRQLLGLLDPQLARQFDQEVAARQRLAQARELGLDLTKVERLNELERTAIVEQAAAERTRIEEQAAEQIARIRDAFFDGVRRSLESLQDLVRQFTASPTSPLPPEEALANAQRELETLLAAAEGGDAGALEKLPEAFQSVVQLAQNLFGSTDAFFAIFSPLLARIEALGASDAGGFQLSDDARAQIDAITANKNEQIATLNKHHDEAMALWQEMLDALLLNEQGQDISQGGGSPGDQVSVPITGGTAGQYGLSEGESRKLQTVLGGAKRGGDIQTEVLAMIAAGDFTGKYGPLLAELFEGATSRNGKLRVLQAINAKIDDPGTFQPVLGFGAGGSFTVNGPGAGDIYPLPVRVAPRETVTVTTHGMDARLAELVAATRQANDTTRRLLAENAAIRAELAALRLTYQQQSARYVPGGAR